ncbi:mitochondrial aspartate-glutamate transporter agc1 [Ascosphaera acerosa]|nr:mitochondrial aspartate-glutamate transporter agc1 [Ascosphaera acerosa]
MAGATDFDMRSEDVFDKYAVTDPGTGERYMGQQEFIDAIAPSDEDYHKIRREQYSILFQVADRKRTGKLSQQDWAAFQTLLSKPDAEYEVAFKLFDIDDRGKVNTETFKKLYQLQKSESTIPFDFNSDWATLYVGGEGSRHELTYPQFAQMLSGLQGERVRQMFNRLDEDRDGFIEPEQFKRIVIETSRHKLSDYLLEHLNSLSEVTPDSKISYADVRAFENIVSRLDTVNHIIKGAIAKSRDGKISRAEFLDEAALTTNYTHITPMEVDILFHFAGLSSSSDRLSSADFSKVMDSSWKSAQAIAAEAAGQASHKVQSTTMKFLLGVVESVHHFALGSIAGAFGALMVYPIDLVKTRMQNQRSVRVGEKMYSNSIDCAKKVIRHEGFRGLYSGVMPQLVGVAPEKAIKLTVNDLVRNYARNKETGQVKYPWELVAGGMAGGCQVVFTNPLEIVKIRLQVQGEAIRHKPEVPRRSAMWIVRHLGLKGLYKGASACLLRDVPFSAIYFPAYAHLKTDLFGESSSHQLGVVQLLTAGAIAGMPAAYFTTPCDVIKTRLQVEARKGETRYTSLRHAAKTIYREEGFTAFFKGGPARILRSSPQFGFTLAAYEVLQNLMPLPESWHEKPAAPPVKPHALPFLKSRNAMKHLLDLDADFGRVRLPAGASWAPSSASSQPDDTAVAILEKHGSRHKGPPSGPLATVRFHEKVTADTREYQGIHPLVALDSHQRNLAKLLQKALHSLPNVAARCIAGKGDGALPLRDSRGEVLWKRKPDFVSVTRGPGMRSNLATGLDIAKGLSIAWQRPLVAVHHMQGHLLTPRLESALAKADQAGTEPRAGAVRPQFPFLSVLVSGGHTMLVNSRSLVDHTVMASTIDIAVGDALDKVARLLLPAPLLGTVAGSMYAKALETFAFPNGRADHAWYEAPASRAGELDKRGRDGYPWKIALPLGNTRALEFSFAGLPSRIKRILREREGEQPGSMTVDERIALARVAMQVCFEHLASRLVLALEDLQQRKEPVPSTLVISGGVAANQFLWTVLRRFLDGRGYESMHLLAPEPQLCTDNALMIGWAGLEMYEAGLQSDLGCLALRDWSLDPSSEEGGILGVEGWMSLERGEKGGG